MSRGPGGSSDFLATAGKAQRHWLSAGPAATSRSSRPPALRVCFQASRTLSAPTRLPEPRAALPASASGCFEPRFPSRYVTPAAETPLKARGRGAPPGQSSLCVNPALREPCRPRRSPPFAKDLLKCAGLSRGRQRSPAPGENRTKSTRLWSRAGSWEAAGPLLSPACGLCAPCPLMASPVGPPEAAPGWYPECHLPGSAAFLLFGNRVLVFLIYLLPPRFATCKPVSPADCASVSTIHCAI